MAQDVFRTHRHFAAAAGRINHIGRHGVTSRVAAQLFHDRQPGAHACAQVRGASNQIALVNVIRLHAAHEQLLQVCLHYVGVVVDMFEQHCLVAERHSGVSQPAECITNFRGQFARMIRVNAHEERVKLLQHCAEFRRDTLRQKCRNSRADAEEFHMRNRAQAA